MNGSPQEKISTWCMYGWSLQSIDCMHFPGVFPLHKIFYLRGPL